MKRNYYCLISGLPEWKWDDRKPSHTVESFRELLATELHADDMKLVETLYLPYDHANILNKLYKKEAPLDTRGKYSADEVDMLASPLVNDIEPKPAAPKYLSVFLNNYFEAENKPDRIQAEKMLAEGWFDLLEKSKNKFLVFYAGFEKLTRNIFTAMLGQKYDTPVADMLVGESEIIEVLRKSRARDFGLSAEVEFMSQLLQIFEIDNLQEREIRFDLFRWNIYDENTFFNYFSIEKILSFIIKLQILERWNALDDKQGRELFERLIAEMQNSYDFPEEYKTSHGKKK